MCVEWKNSLQNKEISIHLKYQSTVVEIIPHCIFNPIENPWTIRSHFSIFQWVLVSINLGLAKTTNCQLETADKIHTLYPFILCTSFIRLVITCIFGVLNSRSFCRILILVIEIQIFWQIRHINWNYVRFAAIHELQF